MLEHQPPDQVDCLGHLANHAVRESVNKSAATAASLVCVKFPAMIKSAASAASLRGGRASGRLDHGCFFSVLGQASGQKIVKISDSVKEAKDHGLGSAEVLGCKETVQLPVLQ